MLTRMMNHPPLLEEIAMGANSPLEACELYGAALGVIEEDSPANILFLRRFAVALKLDDDLVNTIKETLESLSHNPTAAGLQPGSPSPSHRETDRDQSETFEPETFEPPPRVVVDPSSNRST